eukprot:SAG11_NODE_849_length_6877_cov_15.646946_3_plen_75_part_00
MNWQLVRPVLRFKCASMCRVPGGAGATVQAGPREAMLEACSCGVIELTLSVKWKATHKLSKRDELRALLQEALT